MFTIVKSVRHFNSVKYCWFSLPSSRILSLVKYKNKYIRHQLPYGKFLRPHRNTRNQLAIDW